MEWSDYTWRSNAKGLGIGIGQTVPGGQMLEVMVGE